LFQTSEQVGATHAGNAEDAVLLTVFYQFVNKIQSGSPFSAGDFLKDEDR
jgi:hypothetical protein